MTLILSGTDGLSDVDGSAATPAIRGTDANTGIFFGADIIGFAEGGAEVARFNADAQFVAAAGTASLPVITTTGDVNTGIFFPAADTIAFSEGGTEAMRINSSGNVGIGTSSPVGKLYVNGADTTSLGDRATASLVLSNVNGVSNGRFNSILFGGENANTNSAAAIAFKYTTGTGSGYGDLIFATRSVTTDTAPTERARIDSSGNLLVGTTSGSSHIIQKTTSSAGDQVLLVQGSSGFARGLEVYNGQNGGAPNAANAVTKIGQMNVSGRSLNAAGTVNASGADYAEYMTKDGNFTVAKGDLVGINAEGKLTNVFADAVSFVVKSTDPSYVGGDTWGNEEALGLVQPKQPTQRQATEDAEAETDEAFEIRQAAYESDKATFDAALEAARQTVDRIAFAGQVPVNVLSATAGQYIVPVNDNGAIKGEAVSNPTFEQYQIAVGKVIAIESDGRAKIIVKVA
jgi:hypothetical protein